MCGLFAVCGKPHGPVQRRFDKLFFVILGNLDISGLAIHGNGVQALLLGVRDVIGTNACKEGCPITVDGIGHGCAAALGQIEDLVNFIDLILRGSADGDAAKGLGSLCGQGHGKYHDQRQNQSGAAFDLLHFE